MDPQERARLELENAQLAQALLEIKRELNAANQATRDLAAWALNERTCSVTEALHQPDNHVGYLQAPSQEVEHDQACNVTDELVATEGPVTISKTEAKVGLLPIEPVDVLAEAGQQSETPGLQLKQEQRASAGEWRESERSEQRSVLHSLSQVLGRLNNPASAGLTADSIEKFYDIFARKRREREEKIRRGDTSFEGNDGTGKNEKKKKEDRKEDSDDDDSKASENLDGPELAPGDYIAAKMDLDAAFQAVQMQDKDAFDRAITSLTKLGHPYLTAAIGVSLILFACTPAIIGAAEFGAGGVVAGSMAAGVQAGIGNVVTGSAFAVLTSAGMGGAGLAAVMGVSACIPAAVAGSVALWARWQDKKKDDENKMD